MATPDLKAEAGALKKAEGIVNQAYIDFTKLSSNLMNQIDGQAAGWQGRGGAAFTQLHQQWQEKQKTIVHALTQFEASLGETDKRVTGTDHSANDAVSKVAASLGGVAHKY